MQFTAPGQRRRCKRCDSILPRRRIEQRINYCSDCGSGFDIEQLAQD